MTPPQTIRKNEPMNYPIKPFNVKNASEAEYRAANIFGNQMRAEQLPDDPPIPLEEQTQSFQNIPSFVDVHAWGAWNAAESAIIASGSIAILRMEENKHVAELNLEVLPAYRRQGMARKLLALCAEVAQREQRTLLIASTNERVPAGEAFMQRLGAQRGLENHTNQLDLDDLNRALIKDWQARAQINAADFELGLWEMPYPQAHLEEIVALFKVMNTAPRGNLQINDMEFTVEHLLEQEHARAARGTQRWTMYIREKATGKLAGYTEVFWSPHRPQIINQGATGVLPQYRNKGLGRWLKAAMLDKILRERPMVKFIRTDNADSNAPMLKINLELGFKPYLSRCMWQIETARVCAYLNA